MTLMPRPQHIAKSLGPALLLDADRVLENRQRGNMLTLNQATAETDAISGIGVENAATVVRSTAAAQQGVASFLATLTANASNAGLNTSASASPVTPGVTYTAVASFRMSTATSRGCQVKFRWVDANNQQLGGTNFGNSVIATTGGWLQSTVNAVAPAGAVSAYVVAVMADAASLVGDAVFIDELGLFEGTNTTWYHQDLDASQAAQGRVLLADSVQRVLNLMPANTASIETDATGWDVSYGSTHNCSASRTVATSNFGAASLQLSSIAAGDMTIRTPFSTSLIPVTAGQTYMFQAYVKAATTGRTVSMLMNYVDGIGNATPIGGSNQADVTTGWTPVSILTTAPAGSVAVVCYINVLGTTAAGETHYVDGAGVYSGGNLIPLAYPVAEFFHQSLGPGRADTGQAWTNLVGSWGVTNGALTGISASPATMYTDLGATQGTIEADITLGSGFPGFLIRSDNAGANNLVVLYNQGSNLIEVRRYVAATPTVVTSVALPGGASTTGTVRHLKVAISQAGVLTATDTTSNTSVSYTILSSDPAGTFWGLRDAWPGGSASSFKNVVVRDVPTNDGDPDSAVPDGSGKNAHATQPTSSSRPLWRSAFWRNLLTYGVATGADASTLTPTNAQVDVSSAQQAWGPTSFAVQPLNNVPNPSFEIDASGWSSVDQRAVIAREVPGVTRNLLANPSFETDASNWIANSVTSLTRDTSRAFVGSASLLVTWSATAGQAAEGNLSTAVVAGQTYTWTAYVYVPTGNPNVALGAKGVASGTSGFTSVKDAWVRLTFTFVAVSGQSCVPQILPATSTAGTVCYIDAVQAELGPLSTPYVAQVGAADLSAPAGAYVRQSAMLPSTQYSFSAYVSPSITGPVGIYGVQSPPVGVENGPLRRYQMVSKGPGPLIEESTVNLCANPALRAGTLDWGTYAGPNGVASQAVMSDVVYFAGTQSYRIAWTTSATAIAGGPFVSTPMGAVSAGLSYAGSIYVRPSRLIDMRATLEHKSPNGTVMSTSTGATVACPANQWTRLTVTGTAVAGAPMITLTAYSINGPSGTNIWTAGDVLYSTAPQVEQKGYATTYTEGGIGTGYSYDATTNLLANPSLDVNATGWASGDSSSPLARTTAQANRAGGAAAQITGVSAFYRQAVSAQTAYTLSGYVRLPAVGNAGLYLTGSPTPSVESGPTRRYQLVSKGPGPLIEESTVNLLVEPGFEYGQASWFQSTSGATGTKTAAVDSTTAYTGTRSMKLSVTGATADAFQSYSQVMPCLPSTTYTASVWIKGTATNTASANVVLFCADASNAFLTFNETYRGTTSTWQRVTVTLTTAATAATLTLQLRARSQGFGAPGAFGDATFWFDAPQVEQKSYATTYTDGGLGIGYSYDTTGNLVANGAFEPDVSGWASGDSIAPAIARTATAVRSQSHSGATNGQSIYYRLAVAAQAQYTASAQLRVPLSAAAGVFLTPSPTPSVESGPKRRYQMVSKGPGPLVEESTSNLLVNPSFEQDASGYGATAAGTTLSRDTSAAYVGTASLKTVCDGTQGSQGPTLAGGSYLSVAPSTTYTFSVWVKGTGTVVARLQERTSANAVVGATDSTATVLTGTWQRLTVTRTLGSTASFVAAMVIQSVASSATFWTDAWQVEQKAYATTYVDGSLGTGYSYDATTNLALAPSWETSVGGAAAAQSTQGVGPLPTVALSTTRAWSGSSSLLATFPAGTYPTATGGSATVANAYLGTPSLTAGTTYTISVYYYFASGQAATPTLLIDGAAGQSSSATSSLITNGWTRYAWTFTPPSNGTYGLYVTLAGVTTASDVLIYFDGYQVEARSYATPFTTNSNLATNPSFETDTSGWAVVGAGVTIARDTSLALVGTASVRANVKAAVASGVITAAANYQAVTVGQVYTASGWVYSPVAQQIWASIVWYDGSKTYVNQGGTPYSVAANTWTRISYTGAAPAGAAFMANQCYANAPAADGSLWFDAMQIELGGLSNYAGAGTPGTTSTRAAGSLQWTIPSQSSGAYTICGWFRPEAPSTSSTTRGRVFLSTDGADGTNFLYVSHDTSGQLSIQRTGGFSAIATPVTWAAGDLLFIAARVDGTNGMRLYLSVNGAAASTVTNAGTASIPTGLVRFNMGALLGSAFAPAAAGESLMMFSSALLDSDLDALRTGSTLPSTAANRSDCVFSTFVNDSTSPYATQAVNTFGRNIQTRTTVKGETQSDLVVMLPTGVDVYAPSYVTDAQVERRAYPTPYATASNLLSAQDSNFETVNTLGSWVSYGSAGATGVRSQVAALVGANSMLLTLNATASARQAGVSNTASGLVAGLTYTASAWVLGTTATGVGVQIVANGIANSATVTATNGAWQRVSVSWTESGTSRAIAIANANATVGGEQFYVDAIQVEAGGLSNYAGGGTPSTTSTRATGYLEFPVSTTSPLSLAGSLKWTGRNTEAYANGDFMPIVAATGGSGGFSQYIYVRSTGNVGISNNNNGVEVSLGALAVGDIISAVAVFNPNSSVTIYASKNGGSVVTGTTGNSVGAVPVTTIQPGAYTSSDFSWTRPLKAGCPVENIMAFNTVLDATTAGNIATGATVPSTAANRADCFFSAFVNDTSNMTSVSAALWTRVAQQRTTVNGETQSDVVMLMPGAADVYAPEYVDDFQLEQRAYATPYTTNQNLLSANDSSFETSVAGWVAGSGVTATRDTSLALVGTASLKFTSTTGTVVSTPNGATATTGGQTYTASAWVYSSTPLSISIGIQAFTAGLAYISGQSTITAVPANTWTRISVTWAIPANATSVNIYLGSSATAVSFNIDAVQLEAGGLSNYASAGAPGTTATRAGSSLTFPLTVGANRTLLATWKATIDSTNAGIRTIAGLHNGGAGAYLFMQTTQMTNAVAQATVGLPSYVAGDVFILAGTQDSNGAMNYYYSKNGGAFTTAGTVASGTAPTSAPSIFIGGDQNGSRQADAPIANVMAFSSVLDVTTLTNYMNGTTTPSAMATRADCVFSAFIADGPAASANLTAGTWSRVSQTRTTTSRETQTDVVVIPATPQGQDSPIFIDAVQVQKGSLSAWTDPLNGLGVDTPKVAVTAGQTYQARASIRAATVARSPVLFVHYWDAGNAFVGSSNVTQASINDVTTGWTEGVHSFTPPAGATQASLIVGFNGGPPSGEVHYVDKLAIAQGNPSQWVPPVSLPNGQPVWQFDGYDDAVSVPDATARKLLDPIDPATGITAVIVVAFRNATRPAASGANYGYNGILGHYDGGLGGPFDLGVYYDRLRGTLRGSSSIDNQPQVATMGFTTMFDGIYRVIALRGTATTNDIRVNGIQYRVTGTWTAPNVPFAGTPFSLGLRGNDVTNHTGMDVAFLDIVQRALTDGELSRLERDLGRRFGITVA